MSTTIYALLTALYPRVTPQGWDCHAPTPCRYCGLPALDHEVLGERLVCPQAAGEMWTPEEERP